MSWTCTCTEDKRQGLTNKHKNTEGNREQLQMRGPEMNKVLSKGQKCFYMLCAIDAIFLNNVSMCPKLVITS